MSEHRVTTKDPNAEYKTISSILIFLLTVLYFDQFFHFAKNTVQLFHDLLGMLYVSIGQKSMLNPSNCCDKRLLTTENITGQCGQVFDHQRMILQQRKYVNYRLSSCRSKKYVSNKGSTLLSESSHTESQLGLNSVCTSRTPSKIACRLTYFRFAWVP